MLWPPFKCAYELFILTLLFSLSVCSTPLPKIVVSSLVILLRPLLYSSFLIPPCNNLKYAIFTVLPGIILPIKIHGALDVLKMGGILTSYAVNSISDFSFIIKCSL